VRVLTVCLRPKAADFHVNGVTVFGFELRVAGSERSKKYQFKHVTPLFLTLLATTSKHFLLNASPIYEITAL